MKRTTIHALVGLAALAAMGTGSAFATPISPSPTLTVGSLTFSDFSASITGEGSYSPTMATSISVATLTIGQPGIEFTGNFDAFGNGSAGDTALNYSVSASSGTKIDDIWLGLGGATLVGSSPRVTVTECAYADAAHTQLLGNCLSVYDPPPVLTAEMSLDGAYSTVYITKDISYNAGSCEANCNAALSIIDQRFSTVPEPGTLALFGAGLLGCAIFVGRRRRASQTRV